MIDNRQVQKKIFYSFSSIFVIWIILFEFILPSNNIFPKPSIVLESFSDLFNSYNLLINYFTTLSVIYFSILFTYILVSLSKEILLKDNHPFNSFLFSVGKISVVFPSILCGFLLIYWLPDYEISEFIFALLVSFFSFAIKIQIETSTIKNIYNDAAKGLGADEKTILKYVKWKSIQPNLIKHIIDSHIYIWTIILFFEFARNGLGLGKIFRQVLEYKDLSALFALFFITGLTIILGRLAINHLKTKHFFWD
jgi:ABC-type nitrate/sulfonate/bicarbonate transport system permease component